MSVSKARVMHTLIGWAFLLSFLLLPVASHAIHPGKVIGYDPGDVIWTHWGAGQHALADDGRYVWIGAGGSILQLDRASSATRRYTSFDGVPHRYVFAVAVDAAGNRWFGGDAGVSRLDPDGAWTHFNTDNSTLRSNIVDGIALGADGSIWFMHGSEGPVTHWLPDGKARWYTSARAAVVQSYAQVLQTVGANRLWAVSGDEVWIGFLVYDGSRWQDRRPADVFSSELTVRAAPTGMVYVMANGAYEVFRWNGMSWSTYTVGFDSHATALAIDAGGDVWLAWQSEDTPYSGVDTLVGRLAAEPGHFDFVINLGDVGPVNSLLDSAADLWGIGAAWIMEPDFTLRTLDDVPSAYVEAGVITTANEFFVKTEVGVQSMDDQGTARLDDDVWSHSLMSHFISGAFERLLDGGLWAMGSVATRAGPYYYNYRYHDGSWFEHGLGASVIDIFSQTTRDTWFAYEASYGSNLDRGVRHLDDGGTPTDFSDDTWTNYPATWEGWGVAVAVDGLGRLWFADDTGLYRHDGVTWHLIYSDPSGQYVICDIVPASDGTLFVRRARFCSQGYDADLPAVLVVRPQGAQEYLTVPELVAQEFDRVSTASHRNQLWTLAPDGAVWYASYPDVRIARHDGSHLTYYDVPFYAGALPAQAFAVDENNHVWLVAYAHLWRLSPRPSYEVQDHIWLLAPGTTRHETISIRSISGYDGDVTLQLSGLPSGVAAVFATNPLSAGQSTNLTLTADDGVRHGVYGAWLTATDDQDSQIVPITLRVVGVVHDLYAPLVVSP